MLRNACLWVVMLAALVVGLAYLLRDMDLSALKKAAPSYLMALLLLTVLSTVFYTVALFFLLWSGDFRRPLRMVYLVLTASISANYVTPVKVGIPLRIFLYKRFLAIPIAKGTTFVTVETFLGTLLPAVCSVFGIAVLFPSIGLQIPLIVLALLIMLAAGMMWIRPEWIAAIANQWPWGRRLSRLSSFMCDFQQGVRTMSVSKLVLVALLQCLMYVVQAIRLFLVLQILRVDVPIWQLFLVLNISFTAGTLSLIPMGLGVRDASLVVLLLQLGVPREISLSAAVIQRIFSPGWPLVLGLVSTNILGIQLLDARQAAQRGQPSVCLRRASWAIPGWQRLRRVLSTQESRAVAILLAVTCLKGLLWSTAIPLWQAPDEPVHFASVQFIAERGRLPGKEEIYGSEELLESTRLLEQSVVAFHLDRRMTFSDTEEGVNEARLRALPATLRMTPSAYPSSAMHLPPLPYVLGAIAYRLAGSGDIISRAYAVRSVSISLTVAAVLFAYLICRELFPQDPAMRLTVPVLVSFQPVFTEMGAVINSDMLLFFLCSVLTYMGVRMLRHGITPARAVWTGAVLGLGILTKPLIWVAVPPLGLVWLWEWWHRRRHRKRALLGILLVIFTASAVGGWWMLRSQQLNANPFYASPTDKVWGRSRGTQEINLRQFAHFYTERLRTRILLTYWGYFGWDVYAPEAYANKLRIVLALAIVGLGFYGIRALHRRQFSIGEQGMLFFVAWVVSLLAMFAILGFIMARRYGSTQPNHGRYFLGSVVAEMGLLATGVINLFPRRLEFLGHGLLRLGMIAFNLLCLVGFVIPRYYG
jgi:uncharacterized protein (TIRG00374 family)